MGFDYSTPAIIKWQLDNFMDVIDEFESIFADTVHHKVCVGQNYETILLHIVGKSMVTAREILTLCAHGYPDGALSLGRNLYEQMIVISFFEMHKDDVDFQEYVDDFFLNYEVQRNKCFRDIDRYIPDDGRTALEVEWENLKKHTKRKLHGDYWWTNHNSFSELVEHIMQGQTDKCMYKFWGVHYMRYKRACIALHARCMGNSIRIGSNTASNVVDTSPSVYGQSTPLVYAAVSLIAIVGIACSTFQIDNTKHLASLNELAVFYQKQEKGDICE